MSALAADETEVAGGKDPVSPRVAVRWLRMVSNAVAGGADSAIEERDRSVVRSARGW